ncbi:MULTISPECIES: DUF4190 domain-containing protein [unclassified Microbacterium]|uniref:DUF4190 domain-containing protein n=1 Tax=unclassified Microbacterium TaxID=2609290 RepID=UPI0034299D53
MSDNSIPTGPDGQQPTPPPPPAAPLAPPYQATPAYPPAPSYPQTASYPQNPPYPESPTYPTGSPTQAYPGAAPTPAPAYGSASAQPVYPAGSYAQPGAYQIPAYPATIYPAQRPNSGLAITSLICGIAGVVLGGLFFWLILPLLIPIVAVITGHMALRQTKANPAIGGRGMAFAGLIMGYVMVGLLVIGIVMTLISFLLVGAFTLPFVFAT